MVLCSLRSEPRDKGSVQRRRPNSSQNAAVLVLSGSNHATSLPISQVACLALAFSRIPRNHRLRNDLRGPIAVLIRSLYGDWSALVRTLSAILVTIRTGPEQRRRLTAQKPNRTAFVIGEGGLAHRLARERLRDRR
jgi:hypothetical protein